MVVALEPTPSHALKLQTTLRSAGRAEEAVLAVEGLRQWWLRQSQREPLIWQASLGNPTAKHDLGEVLVERPVRVR